MTDTEKLLAEIEEACVKATPGPWENDWALEPSEGHLVHYVDGQLMPNELPLKHAGNLSLIANARTWLPKLVEIVREQDARAQRDELLADMRELLHRAHELQCKVHLDECLFLPAMRKKWGVK